jgi:LCP family protein required for cell wall assembly
VPQQEDPPPRGPEPPVPQYTRYRARRRLPARAEHAGVRRPLERAGTDGSGPARGASAGLLGGVLARLGVRPLRKRRIAALLVGLVVAWLGLSLALFLISSHFERTSPPGNLAAVLDPAGYPLTSANNILVLGSDRRQKNSKEPHAETTGYGRSDSIMLIRTGGGHAARLSIPRDTVVEIPGHGLQKINAAHAFGGPAMSVSVIKRYLGVPINHVIEVNFENFPQLIDAMGGVDYVAHGCVIARLDGGFSQGGYTLHLHKGVNHLDGKAALAVARTRENLCAPSETDIQREEHQQALFTAVKGRLLSLSSFLRLPWIAWNAPPAVISDMSGETLLGLFAALATSSTPPTRVLKPSGSVTLAEGSEGLRVSESEWQEAARRFESG